MISKDPYPEYIKAVLSLVDVSKIKPLKIVVDAGNGMAGKVLPKVFERLPVEVVPMYFKLDGSFPNHLANPLLPEAMGGLKNKVLSEKADLGVGFDGDGDRVVAIDEKGNLFSGTTMTAMIAEYFLKKNPEGVVCYNAVCGRIVPETIRKNGGIPIRTPVGYSIIKKIMKEKKAIFAGEHSYHFFFPSLYYADSGMAALLICLEIFSETRKPASELGKKFNIYPQSGEINFNVENKEKTMEVMEAVEEKFTLKAKSVDCLDGISVWFEDWWFNIRPSNTQSLLRLNVEADNQLLLDEKLGLLIDFIVSQGGKRSFE